MKKKHNQDHSTKQPRHDMSEVNKFLSDAIKSFKAYKNRIAELEDRNQKLQYVADRFLTLNNDTIAEMEKMQKIMATMRKGYEEALCKTHHYETKIEALRDSVFNWKVISLILLSLNVISSVIYYCC